MIKLNELEHAERMKKHGFERECSLYELTIYAKWLRYLGKTTDEVEKELIKFSEEYDKNFNYQIHFYKIDGALERSEKFNLRVPIKITVTENEWETICSTNDDRYRRVLFIMLVLSKYLKNNNTKISPEQTEINLYLYIKTNIVCLILLILKYVKWQGLFLNQLLNEIKCLLSSKI